MILFVLWNIKKADISKSYGYQAVLVPIDFRYFYTKVQFELGTKTVWFPKLTEERKRYRFGT